MSVQAGSNVSGAKDPYRWTERLHDGTEILIRPLSPRDHDEERRFIEGLSAEARRQRFLAQMSHPSEQLVDQLTDVDFVHRVAFAAVVADGGRERIVGVARYGVDADGSCECAVTVADAWQGKGLGTALMRRLIAVARKRGMRSMYSIDAADNIEMLELARFLGFESKLDPGDASLCVHRLELQPEATPPA
jgi:GNAT superfamily N-acetyltransferase